MTDKLIINTLLDGVLIVRFIIGLWCLHRAIKSAAKDYVSVTLLYLFGAYLGFK